MMVESSLTLKCGFASHSQYYAVWSKDSTPLEGNDREGKYVITGNDVMSSLTVTATGWHCFTECLTYLALWSGDHAAGRPLVFLYKR